MTPPRAPLDGVLVLELGRRIAAAVAGSTLAQLGATVIFVEDDAPSPLHPDKLDARAAMVAGKLSLKRQPGDEALLQALVGRCDVVIASSDAGAALPSPDATDTIACDITSCGAHGPLAGPALSDVQLQALSGMLEATGLPGAPPTPIVLPLIEHIGGLYAAAGILCSLRQRRLHGRHERVDIALYDVAFSAMSSFLAPAFNGDAALTRAGNRHTMAAPWNVYRAQDGWVLLCSGSDEQWQRLHGLLMQDPGAPMDDALRKNVDRVRHVDRVDALVQAWVGGRPVHECVQRLGELGIPCGPVTPVDGAPQEANLGHRGMVLRPSADQPFALPGSAFRIGRWTGCASTRVPSPDEDRHAIATLASQPKNDVGSVPADVASLPLAGVRVIEIGHYTTVPVAARTLGALGAEVIKVEPPEGEAVRRWPPARNGQGIFFTFQNTDKQSVCVDLDDPDGAELLARLVATADVLVENLRPGALARKGFSIERLRALNPRLVTCAISGFGADSLYPGRAAFDMVIQAMSGLMSVTQAGGQPLKTGPSICDVMGAVFGVIAMVAALELRDRDGAGGFVDVSMQDVGAWATQTAWNGWRGCAPRGRIVRGAEGDLLVDGDVAVPILTIAQAVHAPHTLARELWFDAQAHGTTFPLLAVPMRLGGSPVPVREPARPLGCDTQHWARELGCVTRETTP